MSEEISFLPEDQRKKEGELKKQPAPPQKTGGALTMHLPSSEDEAVEVIEVDEGEISEVLAGEPLLSRMIFKAQGLFHELTDKLFKPQKAEPPPKLPPQFFKPPPGGPKAVSGLVPLGGAKAPVAGQAAAGGIQSILAASGKPGETKGKARVMPEAEAPRRVRVIKRVRKPVRVSFLEDAELRLRADIPKRRLTLIMTTLAFIVMLGGAAAILVWQGERAKTNLADVNSQIAVIEARIKERQTAWAAFQDLEPRLRALGSLLDGHILSTNALYALEKFTVPEVSYGSFSLSPDGSISLPVKATSFETAARQIVAFRTSGIFTNVQISGFQIEHDDSGLVKSVSYGVSMKIVPTVLNAAASIAANKAP